MDDFFVSIGDFLEIMGASRDNMGALFESIGDRFDSIGDFFVIIGVWRTIFNPLLVSMGLSNDTSSLLFPCFTSSTKALATMSSSVLSTVFRRSQNKGRSRVASRRWKKGNSFLAPNAKGYLLSVSLRDQKYGTLALNSLF